MPTVSSQPIEPGSTLIGMPPRWKRRVEIVHDPGPHVNGPTPGRGFAMLSVGPDAPLSPRARRVFYGVIGVVIAAGIVLVALAR
jgi:hypothetical protein